MNLNVLSPLPVWIKIKSLIHNMNNYSQFLIILVGCSVGFTTSTVSAQDGPVASTANAMMRYYYDNHELVVQGVFTDVTDTEFQLPILVRRDVLATFNIEKVYKAPESLTDDQVTITFTSDMLVFPGESISRYSRRRSILDELSIKLNELILRREDIEKMFSENMISDEQHNDLLTLWGQEYEAVINQSANVSKGSDAIIGSKSFYDLGGYISPGQNYLIFTNKVGDKYSLDPVGSNSYIYWEERFEIFSDILETEVVETSSD